MMVFFSSFCRLASIARLRSSRAAVGVGMGRNTPSMIVSVWTNENEDWGDETEVLDNHKAEMCYEFSFFFFPSGLFF